MNTDTKRHIDSARQVLVGVVPNPTSQIDQITNALIYKFMDDMDQASIKQGGEPAFFVGDLENYAWTRLMDPRMGNQERMNLYGEALIKFSQAKQLPELFRGIFKSAFLPYRSPETLGLFLKEIDYFDYSHPEELGNAYEYLLSIMSSQGDAGQFRTPRHIIDFIVDVVNPTKDDKVLDPACGTGGFLVSSYKHILAQHDGKDDPKKNEKALTPDERKKLMANFEGYDIDPTMVRIAQVNMYLHQFKNPKIFQYDSLSSEERWADKFDVILANPPFMSPKGGIKPHSKFSIPSSRSEVLFVDYIMNHLRPKGRAGIIVPEGIIFQSGTSHKQLRKNLVQDGLYAVVSLPSGVFAPYSGVKTSILLFNNELAKTSKEILFVKIENDGFDLGAQRRISTKNDLPTALDVLNKWNMGKKIENILAVYVEKSKIAENGDYNLSVDRYRIATDYTNTKWPMVKLGDVCEILSGGGFPIEEQGTINGDIPFLKVSDMNLLGNELWINNANNYVNREILKKLRVKTAPKGSIIFPKIGAAIATNKKRILSRESAYDNNVMGLVPNYKINSLFLFYLLKQFNLSEWASASALPSIRKSDVEKHLIPVPPLEIQEQIVTELDGYAGIIAGAKQIVQNWKPKIDIDPDWEKVKLGEVCDVRDGTHDSPKQVQDGYPLITSKNIKDGRLDFSNVSHISKEDFKKVSQRSYVNVGDIIMPMIGTIGGACLIKSKEIEFAIKNVALFKKSDQVIPEYLLNILDSDLVATMFENQSVGATQRFVSLGVLRGLEISFPPLAIQKQIVEKIEAERVLVESSKKLIDIYDQKTKEVIAKLWTE